MKEVAEDLQDLIEESEPIVVNLFGGPGSGKSTGMSYVFSKLKMNGVNAEIAPEYAKERVWQKDFEVFKSQLYYSRGLDYEFELSTLLKKLHSSFNSINFFVTRNKMYNPVGRFQNEEESNDASDEIKKLLDNNFIDYETVKGDETGYNKILNSVLERIWGD